jgi:hypothetical protein
VPTPGESNFERGDLLPDQCDSGERVAWLQTQSELVRVLDDDRIEDGTASMADWT